MSESFLDHQARIGISVHLGGRPASRRLHALCDLAEAREVLDVGCGVGVGPTSIARAYGCRVVGLDRSPAMIEWARRRARDDGVEDRVELVVGDVLALPFVDGRFDVVLVESVLSFVDDKERAIAELVRVTRPGGRIGLNEGFLLTATPSPRVTELARRIGTEMVTLDEWRALWAGSGLAEREIHAYRLDVVRELRDRFRWVGLRSLAIGAIRSVRDVILDPASRPVLRTMFGSLRAGSTEPPGTPPPWASFGYGLFVGRKP